MIYRHRPRHRAARLPWRPAPGIVLLVLTWAAILGFGFGAS
jgi:hypothetical protein